MPAIPPHDTRTVERPWDGPGSVAAAPKDRETLRHMHAVFRGGDPEAKGSYALPQPPLRRGGGGRLGRRDGGTTREEAEMAPINDPVRDGRFWLFADGARLPVVSGGAGDDPPETGDDDPDPEGDHDDDQPETGGDKDRSRQALRKANREAATWRRKFREVEQRIKDAETADQSKLDKLTAMMEAAEKRASDAERKALVAEVAQAKGLAASQAKRLHGSTREELEDDADELLEAFGGAKPSGDASNGKDGGPPGDGDDEPKGDEADKGDAKPKPASTGKPREKLRSGAAPNEEPEPDADKVAESILKKRTLI